MHELHIPRVIPCSVQLVARPNHAQNVIILCVACILMHDRIAHGTFLFVQQVARYGSVISYRSVHLDARMISPRYGMKCSGFLACFFVQQVARYGGEWFNLGAWLTISCNKLHATGALFHIVACILMHEWLPSQACFFVQQVARYGEDFPHERFLFVQCVARNED